MTTERLADTSADLGDVEERVLEALEDLDAPAQPTDGAPWKVTDKGQADWALRKLAKARAELAEVQALAARERQQLLDVIQPELDAIAEYERSETDRISHHAAHWEAVLGVYHRGVLVDDPKAKTLRLPHGTLVARKNPDTWEFAPEFEAWAKAHRPDLLRTEVTKPAAKKALSINSGHVVADVQIGAVDQATGDIPTAVVKVPGVAVIGGEVRFAVQTEEVAK